MATAIVREEDMVQQAQDLEKNIKDASIQFQLFSLALRSCYNENNANVQKFRQLRDDIHTNTVVYKQSIFPLAIAVVENIHEYFDFFLAMDESDWKENLQDIADQASVFQKQALFVVEMHEAILTDFKINDNVAKVLVQELKLQGSDFRKKAEVFHSKSQQVKDSTSVGWYILSMIPVVGEVVTALCPDQSVALERSAVAAKTDAEIVDRAVVVVENVLLPALVRIVQCVKSYSAFFQVLEFTLRGFLKNTGSAQEKGTKMYYNLMKKKAVDVQKSTEFYIASIPAIKANFNTIDVKEGQKNYVQKWLDSHKVSTGQTLSVSAAQIFGSLWPKLLKSN